MQSRVPIYFKTEERCDFVLIRIEPLCFQLNIAQWTHKQCVLYSLSVVVCKELVVKRIELEACEAKTKELEDFIQEGVAENERLEDENDLLKDKLAALGVEVEEEGEEEEEEEKEGEEEKEEGEEEEEKEGEEEEEKEGEEEKEDSEAGERGQLHQLVHFITQNLAARPLS